MTTKTPAQLRAREAALVAELERRKSPSERQADALLGTEVEDGYDPDIDTSRQQANHLLGES
ncbi:hypothetical protein [Microbacterium sp. SY138]|uniref:hypothetical protein n=1 Tax=Microbacterium sp. SY138 TaxID=3149040 RepID=UPI00321B3E53